MSNKFLLYALAVTLASHAAAGTPEDAQLLLAQGAPDLALVIIEQKHDAEGSPAWIALELLRWEAWAQQGKFEEIIHSNLLQKYKSKLDDTQLAQSLRLMAAATSATTPTLSNEYFLQSNWLLAPASKQRENRLKIVENQLKTQRFEDAYRSLLRFQQDFGQVPKNDLNRALGQFLKYNQEHYALSWLEQLPPNSSLRSLIELRLGKVSAEQLLAGLQDYKGPQDDQQLLLMHELAKQLGHHSLKLWVEEKQMAAGTFSEVSGLALQYEELAKESGNRENLVIGDDEAWSRFAITIQHSNPVESRAIYYYLAQNAQNETIREQALLNLLNLSLTNGTERTVLNLIDKKHLSINPGFEVFRYEAGLVAYKIKKTELCAQLWEGLNPIQETPAAWLDHLVDLQSIRNDRAKLQETLGNVARQISTVTNEQAQLSKTLIKGALNLAKLGDAHQAESLLQDSQDHISSSEKKNYWVTLAKVSMLTGKPKMVASAYLLAAQQEGATEEQRGIYKQTAIDWLELAGSNSVSLRTTTNSPSKLMQKKPDLLKTQSVKPKNK